MDFRGYAVERSKAATDAVPIEDMRTVAERIHDERKRHPVRSTCECVAFEAVLALLDLGYTIVPPGHTVKP